MVTLIKLGKHREKIEVDKWYYSYYFSTIDFRGYFLLIKRLDNKSYFEYHHEKSFKKLFKIKKCI